MLLTATVTAWTGAEVIEHKSLYMLDTETGMVWEFLPREAVKGSDGKMTYRDPIFVPVPVQGADGKIGIAAGQTARPSKATTGH